jgi:serine/threonine protein kinase
MPSGPDPNDPTADPAVLSVRADQFFAALTRGEAADWEPFLVGLTGRLRVAVLTELVVIDLAHRWGKGERPVVEEYVERFPEIGPADRVPPALILEEYRCRVKAGEAAPTESYRRRFPVQFAALETQLGPGQAVTHTVRRPEGDVPSIVAPPRPHDGVVAVAQQYQLVRELGRGMFGEVWLARKNPSGIEKAIKILHQPADQEIAQRELRSLELIKNLRHPYLLATEDFWVANNRLYIVLELADATLRSRLNTYKETGRPGVPEDELLGYMREAAEGLDYLHAKHITHRDVKPDNILLLNGHSKVADFGLARQQEQMVASMSFAGTPAYMAPEVWGGEGGPPSDQYGLAVVCAELRQGRPPFRFGRGAEVMFAHVESRFDFDDVIPEPEREVLRRGMAREPADRYPSCAAFVEELAAAMGRPVLVRRSGVVPVARRTPDPPAPHTDDGKITRTVVTGATAAWKPEPAVEDRPRKSKVPLALAGLLGLGLAAGSIALWEKYGKADGTTQPTGTTPTKKEGDGKDDKKAKVNGDDKDKQKDKIEKKPDPVVPKPPELVFPRGTRPVPDTAKVELARFGPVPEWVVADVDGVEARFRLIVPNGNPGSPEPFYISESKVWNGLYRKKPDPKAGPRTEPGGDDAPAVNLTANQAAAFAAAAFPGGRLPTPAEWDHAAGLYNRRNQTGPLLLNGTARIGLPEPVATRGMGADATRNQYGLFDLAGNGREWTAAALPGQGQPLKLVSGAGFEPTALVVLRGRTYTAAAPLSYTDLAAEQKEPQTQFAGKPSPYTGFRVVLPLP